MLRGFIGLCKRALGDDTYAANADQAALGPVNVDAKTTGGPKCRAIGTMRYHADYPRHFIYLSEGKTHDKIISIIRLKCDSCGATHAVLPLAAIPYLSYSICFIAALLADWISGTWPSIEAISGAYCISAKTFMRLKRRFLASVALAVGKTEAKGQVLAYARRIALAGTATLAGMVSDFIALTGRMLCEGLLPSGKMHQRAALASAVSHRLALGST